MTRPWTHVVLVLALLVGTATASRAQSEQRDDCVTRTPRVLVKVVARIDGAPCPRNHDVGHHALIVDTVVPTATRGFTIVETPSRVQSRAETPLRTHGARAPPPM